MKRVHFIITSLILGMTRSVLATNSAEVIIAQISDTHLGEKHSPRAAENLAKVVELINARHPDAVILSGDIGESAEQRGRAKEILKGLRAPTYYVPGNHDLHNATGLAQYRKTFGRDYYRFSVKNVEVFAIDSLLLGNYQKFEGTNVPPLLEELRPESQKMLGWLEDQIKSIKGKTVIAVQHIPLFRDNGFPDAKPYWTVNEPYAQREAELFHKLGVKHLLAGHWHNGRVFEHDGITIHVAPATSWLPLGGKLGFAVHTIASDGTVKTELVSLPVEADQ